MTAEQEARDMLERMGYDDAQERSAGEVVELANLIHENERLTCVQGRTEQQARELAAAKADAERYRWLREGRYTRQGVTMDNRGGRSIEKNERYSLMEFNFWCMPQELDAAIDAARAKWEGK